MWRRGEKRDQKQAVRATGEGPTMEKLTVLEPNRVPPVSYTLVPAFPQSVEPVDLH